MYEAKGSLISKTHSLRLLFPNGPVYVEAAFFNDKTETMLLFQSHNVSDSYFFYTFKMISIPVNLRYMLSITLKANMC